MESGWPVVMALFGIYFWRAVAVGQAVSVGEVIFLGRFLLVVANYSVAMVVNRSQLVRS